MRRRFSGLRYLDFQQLESLISFNISQSQPQWPQPQGSFWDSPDTKNVTVDFINKYNTIHTHTHKSSLIVTYTLF
jgi:hypothetical protein